MWDFGFAIYTVCKEGKQILVNNIYFNYKSMRPKYYGLVTAILYFMGNFIIIFSEKSLNIKTHLTLLSRPPPGTHLPHSQLPRSLQLAVVHVDASGVQVTCGDSDHPPGPGHVQVAGVVCQGGVTH